MPLKKVIADFSRGVFSPLGGKKGSTRNSVLFYQNPDSKTVPNKHIYYEPPEEFDWDVTSALLDNCYSTGEIIVHRLPAASPDSNPKSGKPTQNETQNSSPPALETQSSEATNNDDSASIKDKEKERAYTEEEFRSAILARKDQEADQSSSTNPSLSDVVTEEVSELVTEEQPDMADSGVASMVRDTLVVNSCQSLNVPGEGREECDCERRCSNPKHLQDCKNSDYAVSPVLERRNKGVLGRLRNFASRTSYSNSEDGHSHSSDYEDLEEDKKADPRFYRDSRERTSSSWAGRVRDLHRDVKKKISRLRNSRGANPEEEGENAENSDIVIQPGSSVESIPSGSGSSLQPPTPTSSNRSSTSAGEDDHSTFVGTFIGRAKALVDCTPSPYDRDGLAFKKGDIIDIIAKHKTGIWVGMAQGKVGHFKFINVEEFIEDQKTRSRRRRANSDWLSLSKKPETLEELLKLIGLEEYINVLVLNGYDELDTFKEIEKIDLDNLGIVNQEHSSKLLRAAELLQDVDFAEELEDEEDTHLNQSPRDSGCYASHENLIHQDVSNRALSNGQFTVDLDDQDTSHSESGIHSRECQDSVLNMNNLDLSGESLAKSSATTMDDVAEVVNANDFSDTTNDHCNYNIPPHQDNAIVNNDEDREINISVNAVDTPLPRSEQDFGPLSVPYFLSTSGTKSSPGSPRKARMKHSRNKSHCHRSKDLLNDYSFNSYTYNISRCRQLSTDSYPDRGGYVYGWASFSKTDKSSRRNLHEYDDIVSDPATETEDSPGRHVYRRVKQRKGSLQTLIHDTRSPSPTLISKINKRLVAEKIYLHEEPYTDKTGFCGIPPALVQRYSEELQHSIVDVADALDQIRITALQQQNRRGVPNDFLSDSCVAPVIEPNYSNLQVWLISLGLPMYVQNFFAAGITELYHIASLNIDDLGHLGIHDPYHQIYLESALGVLYAKFQRRPQTYTQGHSLS